MEVNIDIALELGLSQAEYELVLQRLGRVPTFSEIGVISVMWSEHCSYKSSKKILKTFPKSGDRLMAEPGAENAGVLELDEKYAIVFKVESHNHPSAVAPFQGAATGVGGILRDIFAMGARPVAILDSLRFGNPEDDRVRYLFNGVVSGISHYGNCIGVPTIGGETIFDDCYGRNPLVNVMALGIVRKDQLLSAKADIIGATVIYVGAATGRDGIHGATFASVELSENSEEDLPSVQIGDPFLEKLLLEATLEIAEKDLAWAVQDMGAAGLTSSSTEMAHSGSVGMELDLDRVPIRAADMSPYEMLLSESQERMLIVARPDHEREIEEIFDRWGLHYAEIGKTIEGDRFICRFRGEKVVDLPLNLISGSDVPQYDMPCEKPQYLLNQQNVEIDLSQFEPLELIDRVASDSSVASKAMIYRQYDTQVGTNTVVRPGDDAAVIRWRGSKEQIAMSIDGNGVYTYLDPYAGGQIAVAEGIRNVVAMGAEPVGITNCLNFGNPQKPEVFWTFREATRGMSDVCRKFNIPVTGGNVSFYNESPGRAVYPTPVVGVVGIIRSRVVPGVFQDAGHVIAAIGIGRKGSWGGTVLQKITGEYPTGNPPQVDLDVLYSTSATILHLSDVLSSCRDMSEGGILASVIESINDFGASIDLDMKSLLYEYQSAFLISYDKEHEDKILKVLKNSGIDNKIIGLTLNKQSIVINGEVCDNALLLHRNSLQTVLDQRGAR